MEKVASRRSYGALHHHCLKVVDDAAGDFLAAMAAVALNTSRPERVAENLAAVDAVIPQAFWAAAKDDGLIQADYPYLS